MAASPRTLVILIPALLLGPALALALPPLEQLETRIELSPAAQLAERAYESTRDSLSAGRIGLGVSAFGSVGYAHNHDIIDPVHSWTYNQGVVGGGLSVPVLGSRLQLEDSLSEQQVQLMQLDARRQLQRRELVARLRKAYGDYWQGQRLQLLARNYLQDEPTLERVVELRTRAGLLLDADRLELLSGFALARRDAAAGGADREVALGLMRELTGQDLDGGIAVRPVVPTACVRNLDASDDWPDSDPELVGLRRVVALREPARVTAPCIRCSRTFS
jgi:outer membrane protein TolC